MINHFLGKTHKFGANKTHFAKWWISPVVSIQIDFFLVKGQKRHIQKVLCKASRRSNCCLNDALDPCHQVPFIFIFTAIIIVIINTKMKPLKSVWVVPHGWTLNQHETWNMKHHPWRWKRIVQDQELNPLQAIHYPEGADDGRISSPHQSTKTCVLFKSLLVRSSTVLLSLDHIRPNPLRCRCIRYIEIGGPVSMGQRTTEILIQFWIFAASPLKRPCIYLVGPTVDERNPPSSWKQRSHFKGHWWAKSIQHWNLLYENHARVVFRKIPENILHHYLPLLNQGFLFHHPFFWVFQVVETLS